MEGSLRPPPLASVVGVAGEGLRLGIPLLGGFKVSVSQTAPGSSVQLEARVTPGLHQSGNAVPVGTHGLLTFSPGAAKRPQ